MQAGYSLVKDSFNQGASMMVGENLPVTLPYHGGEHQNHLDQSYTTNHPDHQTDGTGSDCDQRSNQSADDDILSEGEARRSIARGRQRSNPDSHQPNVLQQKWYSMFQRLLEFNEKHGHCLVPNRYANDHALGAWVSTQRRQYKILVSGSSESTPMTPERAAKLEAIGFIWATTDPRHVPWQTRYDELCEYRELHGNCLVPIGHKDNVKLANWVSTQRQEYKLMREGRSSRLSEERIQLLDAVKFVWEAQRGGPRKRSKKPNDDGSTSPSPKKKKSTSNEKPGKVTIPSYTEQARNLLRTQGLPGVPAYAATAPDAPTMPRIPPQGHQQRARSPPFAPGPSPFAPGPSHFAPRPSPFASVHPPTAFEPLAAVYAKIGAAASAKTATKVANAGAGNFYPRPAPIPVPGYGSESTNSATIYWPPPQHVASDREVADKVNSYEAGDAMLFQQVRQQAAQAQDQARAQHMAKAKSDKLADAKAQALAEAQEQDQDRALAQAQAQDQNRALAQAQAQAHARVHGHAHAQHAMMQQQAQAARQVAAQPQPITKQASYTTHQAHQSYPGTARRPAAGPPAPQHRYPIHGETGAQRVDGFSSNGQQPPRQRPSTGPPVAQHHYPVNGGTGAQRVNVFNSRQAPQQGQAAPKAPAQEQHPDDCFAAPAFIFNVPAKAIQSPASPKTPTKVKPPASPKANFQSQAAVKEELPVPASNEDESGIFDDADDDIY